jgi:hypothetical protein
MIDKKLDKWILKQLRGLVLTDVRDFIPEGYFDGARDLFPINEGIEGGAQSSFEMRWGYLAGTLGRKMYFHSSEIMSARQISAFEVLMHLGILASLEASRQMCDRISRTASSLNAPDGNSGSVAKQMEQEHLPTLRQNLLDGLKQYMLHLSDNEAKPFLSLIQNAPLAPIHLF